MSQGAHLTAPDVTVITPVHNTVDCLRPWFDSLLGQSLPRQRIEVIAVDDGCSDGGSELLDELAAEHPGLLTVLHQPASGGPALPRNRALDLATGRYVFFLDSDDRLGPEALERLTGYGDRTDADVVLGRIAGVNGRRVPKDVFRCNLERASVDRSGILYALTPAKLFRRELLEQNGMRFREELRIGSDHPFVVEAYLRAGRVSVLADYTCYYLVARDGGGNISLGDSVTASLRLPYMRAAAETVLRLAGPGPELDALIKRNLRIELTDLLGPAFAASTAVEQQRDVALLNAFLDDWYHPGIAEALPSWVRLRIHCLRNGKVRELHRIIGAEKSDRLGFRVDGHADGQRPPIVSGGRAYANLPGFRDTGSGIPDTCFDVTDELRVDHLLSEVHWDRSGLRLRGTAGIAALGPGAVQVLARERDSGREVLLRTNWTGADGTAAFRARWPAGSDGWTPGIWDLVARVRQNGISREARIGSSRASGLVLPKGPVLLPRGPRIMPLTCYWTHPYQNLSVRVDAPRTAPPAVSFARRIHRIAQRFL
jgi:CDP-glycerol glycerophosphotransferase